MRKTRSTARSERISLRKRGAAACAYAQEAARPTGGREGRGQGHQLAKSLVQRDEPSSGWRTARLRWRAGARAQAAVGEPRDGLGRKPAAGGQRATTPVLEAAMRRRDAGVHVPERSDAQTRGCKSTGTKEPLRDC